ncbi:unnamed protein product [Caretta caretta]
MQIDMVIMELTGHAGRKTEEEQKRIRTKKAEQEARLLEGPLNPENPQEYVSDLQTCGWPQDSGKMWMAFFCRNKATALPESLYCAHRDP